MKYLYCGMMPEKSEFWSQKSVAKASTAMQWCVKTYFNGNVYKTVKELLGVLSSNQP
jgi:hypothetical protein